MGVVGTTFGLLAGCHRDAGGSSPVPDDEADVSGHFLVEASRDPVPAVPSDVTAGGDGATQKGFVVVQDYIPSVMADVRYHGTYNFVGERIDGYEEPLVILSVEAADALRAVGDEAASRGYRLRLYDGYRPQRAVDHFCRWAESDDVSMKPFFYPGIDKGDIFPQGYVARQSGHSRGSTVDLTLFDMASGQDADMGGTFDHFGEESHPDHRATLSEGQYRNRMELRDMMVAAGFDPCPNEWWHFTLAGEPYPDTYFDFPVSYSSLSG